jgi:hypothetical protein
MAMALPHGGSGRAIGDDHTKGGASDTTAEMTRVTVTSGDGKASAPRPGEDADTGFDMPSGPPAGTLDL